MPYSVLKIGRPVRRRLLKVVQSSPDKEYARRAQAVLTLEQCGGNVSETHRRTHAARSAVHTWRSLFERGGVEGLRPQARGREDWKATAELLEQLATLVRTDPTSLGYLRSRWSSELLAVELRRCGAVQVHATTIRRWLARREIVWRRARPTLCITDPQKPRKMRVINHALRHGSAQQEVFYVDEADIDLNPRIGATWVPRGQQATVPTPGKNRKCYVAGALNARTGKVLWVEHTRKDSELFVRLLETLVRSYRRATKLSLIVDNYIIHRSRMVQGWLKRHPRVKLLFQPAYHPWVNAIERLWKQLHDTITRNHRCGTMDKLMNNVDRFMEVCQPFPGSRPALARAA